MGAEIFHAYFEPNKEFDLLFWLVSFYIWKAFHFSLWILVLWSNNAEKAMEKFLPSP